MLFGRLLDVECLRHGLLDQCLIVYQHQRQDVDHLTVTTGTLEQLALQLPEAIG
jgi:hypothetical protein